MPRVFRGEPASLSFGLEAQLRAAARAAREDGAAGDDSGEAQNNKAPLQPNVAAAPAPDEIQVVDAVEVEAGAEDDVTEQDEQPSGYMSPPTPTRDPPTLEGSFSVLPTPIFVNE